MSYLTRTSPRRPDRPVSSRTGPIRQPAVSLPRRNAIVALYENGAPALLWKRHCRSKIPTLIFYVFDLLFDAGADLRPQPLSDRGARLRTLLADHGPGDAARVRLFHSKALDTNDSFSFTFAKPEPTAILAACIRECRAGSWSPLRREGSSRPRDIRHRAVCSSK